MNYKPLPFYLTIKKSNIHGLGLHSLAEIPKDTTIGMTHIEIDNDIIRTCLLYTSPSPRDGLLSRMPSSA